MDRTRHLHICHERKPKATKYTEKKQKMIPAKEELPKNVTGDVHPLRSGMPRCERFTWMGLWLRHDRQTDVQASQDVDMKKSRTEGGTGPKKG
jgi:hypothetical protein